MAFRGDIQGGSNNEGLQGLVGGQAVAGIEKTMKWKLGFFTGAVIVTASAIMSSIHWITHLSWAPATFIDNMFLFFFGFLMIVLDFPIPHPSQHLVNVRDNAYKFVLFMTRFMGRGIWYLFLATLVLGAVWPIQWLVACALTAYLVILGVAAFAKGWMMSLKLHQVREAIVSSGRGAESYLAPRQRALSKAMFQAMVEHVTNQKELFTSDELDYVINALSFTPENDGQVSMEECEYWLRGANHPMLMV